MAAEPPEEKRKRLPSALLISAVVISLIGAWGLFTSFPEVNDELRPDRYNEVEVSPNESTQFFFRGGRVYAFFQNTTESGSTDGSVTLMDGEEEVSLNEPSITSGIGEMTFSDQSKFSPIGWIGPAKTTEYQITSESNQTTYIVDQTAVSEEIFTRPAILTSCLLITTGLCLIPISLILIIRQKRARAKAGEVTFTTPTQDGHSETPPSNLPEGTLLTTDQLYAFARLEEMYPLRAIENLETHFRPPSTEPPPPFSDRPDPLPKTTPPEVDAKREGTAQLREETDATAGDSKSSGNWKDWDEG